MKKHNAPRSVAREEFMKKMVSEADAFSALRYLRHREVTPRLIELEGSDAMPAPEAVLADLYYSLWDSDPAVKSEAATPTDLRYWRTTLEATQASNVFRELHAATQLSDFKSIIGTISMGEQVLALVPKEDKEKLRELSSAQQTADQLEQDAQAADAAAIMAEMLASSAEASAQAGAGEQAANGQGQPGGKGQSTSQSAQNQSANGQGQPGDGNAAGDSNGGAPSSAQSSLSPAQAKTLANELAKQATAARVEAQAARELADEAAFDAEVLAEELMGKPGSIEAADKLRELARIGLAAAQKARDEVHEVSDTLRAWGLDEGELTKQGIPEAMGVLARMKKNPAFKKFAALLGRIRQIAAQKARTKTQAKGIRRPRIETGRDIRRAQRRELVALVHPATRTQALTRWARGELCLHGEEAKQKLGHGPVIVCEDGSGSMDGSKQQWAKAVSLAFAHYAKIQKRTFGWMLFDTRVQRAKTYPQGKLSAEQVLEIAEARSGGGTDFEAPLRRALQMITTEGLNKADIVFITDGECAVSDAFLSEFRAAKKRYEFNVFTVLVDTGSSARATVAEFSDKIEIVSSFTADTAGAIFNKF